MGCHIAINMRNGFKLQVASMPGFHSLYDRYYQMIQQCSGAPEGPEIVTAMEEHGAEVLYSVGNSSMHGFHPEDGEAPQDAVHMMTQIA